MSCDYDFARSVSYAVLFGLLFSINKEVTVPLPPGFMMDMEAILAGSPEAFVNVTKPLTRISRLAAAAVTILPSYFISTDFSLRLVSDLSWNQ